MPLQGIKDIIFTPILMMPSICLSMYFCTIYGISQNTPYGRYWNSMEKNIKNVMSSIGISMENIILDGYLLWKNV